MIEQRADGFYQLPRAERLPLDVLRKLAWESFIQRKPKLSSNLKAYLYENLDPRFFQIEVVRNHADFRVEPSKKNLLLRLWEALEKAYTEEEIRPHELTQALHYYFEHFKRAIQLNPDEIPPAFCTQCHKQPVVFAIEINLLDRHWVACPVCLDNLHLVWPVKAIEAVVHPTPPPHSEGIYRLPVYAYSTQQVIEGRAHPHRLVVHPEGLANLEITLLQLHTYYSNTQRGMPKLVLPPGTPLSENTRRLLQPYLQTS